MDRDFLIELFSEFGPVTVRPMFSGHGISADGVNFAMALRSGLYFRADAESIPDFEAEGKGPFQYESKSRSRVVTVNSYWQIPDRLFDDPGELAQWAGKALAAAQRAAIARPKRPRKEAAAAAKKKPAAKKRKKAVAKRMPGRRK